MGILWRNFAGFLHCNASIRLYSLSLQMDKSNLLVQVILTLFQLMAQVLLVYIAISLANKVTGHAALEI